MPHLQRARAGALHRVLLISGLLSSTPAPADAQAVIGTADVLIVNQASLDAGTLEAARSEVERLFGAAGIGIIWHEQVPGSELRLFVVCITHEPVFAMPVSRQALGAVEAGHVP